MGDMPEVHCIYLLNIIKLYVCCILHVYVYVRLSLGVTIMDQVRDAYIRGTAKMGRWGDKIRAARLRWFGHMLRKDDAYWEKDAEDGTARKDETGKV